MAEFISCTAQGCARSIMEPRDVVVSIAGPKGGKRALEQFSFDEARYLRDQLNAAIAKIERRDADQKYREWMDKHARAPTI